MSLKYDPAWLIISNVSERYWAFYRANEKEYDKILWDAAWKHANTIDPEDMHSDLLLRMYRSNFLTSFDPTKSAFGTFVTGRVLGYASHFISSHLDETKGLHKAFFSGLNNIDESSDEASPELRATNDLIKEMDSDLSVESTFDYSLFDDVVMQEINRALTPSEARVFNLYKTGYNFSEIAKKVKMSDRIIVKEYISKIKGKICEIFEGVKILCKGRDELTPCEEKVLIILKSKGLFIEENGTFAVKNVVIKKDKSVKQETTPDQSVLPIISKKRENGHAISKKRDLSKQEKEVIKGMFVSINGMIKEDTSLKMKAAVGKDISIFQVTGYIVGLHGQVSRGELELRDLRAYKTSMASHRKQWATYQSSKYQTPKYQAALV